MTALEEELIELVAVLADAVQTAVWEFEMLRETPQPMPDGLDARLTERMILMATLKRLTTGDGAKRLGELTDPDAIRTYAADAYREEREKAPSDEYELPNFPPLPEVEAQLGDAFDTVRRRRLLVPELYAALGRFG